MRRLLLICGLSLTLAWPAAALADESSARLDAAATAQAAADSDARRDGVVLGLDFFAGAGLESGSSVAAGLGVQIGWMIRPTIALMLDTHGAAVGSNEIGPVTVSPTIRVRALAAAAVKWWPSERFWVLGGVGQGRVEGVTTAVGIIPSASLEQTQNGVGATVAAGYDVYHGELFALDLNVRYSGIHAGDNNYSSILFGLGLGWYP